MWKTQLELELKVLKEMKHEKEGNKKMADKDGAAMKTADLITKIISLVVGIFVVFLAFKCTDCY